MGVARLDLLVARYRDGPRADPPADVPPALLLGDSTLERASDHDTDKTALAGMIRTRMPVRTLSITCPAYSPVHFAAYARVLAALPARPRLVIAPVNIRCLSPQWDALPRYRWLHHLAAIRQFLKDPEGAVPDAPPALDEAEEAALHGEARALRVASAITGETTLGALEDIRDSAPVTEEGRRARVRQIVAYHYGLPFAPDHACLTALGDMVRVLRGCGVRVLLYATPVNVDFAERLGGEGVVQEIARKVAAARDTVTAASTGGEVSFLDLHRTCRAEHFLHRGYMVEHMDQHGRAAVAGAISAEAERLLSNR